MVHRIYQISKIIFLILTITFLIQEKSAAQDETATNTYDQGVREQDATAGTSACLSSANCYPSETNIDRNQNTARKPEDTLCLYGFCTSQNQNKKAGESK